MHMALPGWYPDPSGHPQTFRYWDGQAWSQQTTTDPRTPPPPPSTPAAASAAPAGAATRRSPWPWVVGGLTMSLPLVVALAYGLVNKEDPEPTSPPPATTTTRPSPRPSAGTGPDTPAGTQLNCSAGAGQNQRGTSPTRAAAGIQYDAVPGWTWSFSSEMFPWLDEMTAYGDVKRYNNGSLGAGIAIGGMSRKNGFTDPKLAVSQAYECIQRYGLGADGGYDWPTLGAVEQTTIGGMPAWRANVSVGVHGASQKIDMMVAVVDSGLGTGYTMVNTFVPDDDAETRAKIDTAMRSMRRG
ncbi:hypothetical protein GCM10027418_02830 [Mariniluteicoccus endophyticus]